MKTYDGSNQTTWEFKFRGFGLHDVSFHVINNNMEQICTYAMTSIQREQRIAYGNAIKVIPEAAIYEAFLDGNLAAMHIRNMIAEGILEEANNGI